MFAADATFFELARNQILCNCPNGRSEPCCGDLVVTGSDMSQCGHLPFDAKFQAFVRGFSDARVFSFPLEY